MSLSEGRDLASQFNSATFYEVSVADSPYESVSIIDKVVREIIRMKKVRYRPLIVSLILVLS